MPWCPECKFEYRPEITTCPDCDATLVSHLPPKDEKPVTVEPEPRYQDWQPFAALTSDQYAQMFIEVLIDHDIPAVLHSGTGHFGTTGQMGISSYRPVSGAYVVMVPPEHHPGADDVGAGMFGDDWPGYRLVDPTW